jgi:tetratricopeptide (TPR) repeat protein
MQEKEALTQFQKAIQIEQESCQELGLSKEYLSLYYNNKGLALYHLSNFDEAIKEYQNAIDCLKDSSKPNPENFFNLGNVYLRLAEQGESNSSGEKYQFDEAHQ